MRSSNRQLYGQINYHVFCVILSIITFLSWAFFLIIGNHFFGFGKISFIHKINWIVLLLGLILNIILWGLFILNKKKSGYLHSFFYKTLVNSKGILLSCLFFAVLFLGSFGAFFFLFKYEPGILLRFLPTLFWISAASFLAILFFSNVIINNKKVLFGGYRFTIIDLIVITTALFYSYFLGHQFREIPITLFIKDLEVIQRNEALLSVVGTVINTFLLLSVISMVLWLSSLFRLHLNKKIQKSHIEKIIAEETNSIRSKTIEDQKSFISRVISIHGKITDFFVTRGNQLINKINPVLFWTLFSITLLVSLFIRLKYITASNPDMVEILKWYDHIAQLGGFTALSDTTFSSYNIPYLFLLAIGTYFSWIPKLVAIKLISILFDLLCAFAIYKIVKYFTSVKVSSLAFLLVLLVPVSWLTSAYWGQSDSIYSSFILLSIYFFLRKKNISGLILFSIALGFKLQGVFLIPFILALMIMRNENWKLLSLIPFFYLVAYLPSILAGQSFKNLFNSVLAQTNQQQSLTYNGASLFGFFKNITTYQFGVIGYVLLTGCIAGLCFFAYKKAGQLGDKTMILLAATSLIITPFLLPRMHERYFYPISIFSISILFIIPRLWLFTLLTNVAIFYSYFQYLWGYKPVDLPYLSVMNLFSIVILICSLLWNFRKKGTNRIQQR